MTSILKRASLPFTVGVAIVFAAAAAAMPISVDERGTPTLAPLLEKITPAVVNVAVVSRVSVEQNPLFRDPFFRRFFNLPDELPDRERVSAGSGVIVDAAKGYILTNHHVIEKADEIRITLKDRRTFEAELVGSDPGTDIALLKIEPQNLTAVPLGDSDALKVGDFVIAIGNPFGLGQTVTSGIVSALGRSGLNIEGYEDFIQTDASINPGNSGGALVNLKGELVGINTAIIGPAGGNVGIGFAVPSNMARAVVDQLLRYGEVRRGRLGVSIQDLTPDLAEAMGLDTKRGAVVIEVEPDSPAARAGLRAGDVIVAVDGRHLRGSADLRNRIGLVPVGEKVTIEFLRDGRSRTVTVAVDDERKEVSDNAAGTGMGPALAGATFREIDGDAAPGIRVVRVEPGSPAWRNGLRADDIVVAVNRKPVHSMNEFQRAVRAASRVLALSIRRGGADLFLVIR